MCILRFHAGPPYEVFLFWRFCNNFILVYRMWHFESWIESGSLDIGEVTNAALIVAVYTCGLITNVTDTVDKYNIETRFASKNDAFYLHSVFIQVVHMVT